MRTISGIDDAELTALLSSSKPVASVYADIRAASHDEYDVQSRWRALADRLAAQGAPAKTVDALADRVLGAAPGPGVLAAFATGPEAVLTVELPGSTQLDLARYGLLPHLTPLLAWLQDHPARVVAVLDRTGADISSYPAGRTEPIDSTVSGPDDEIERNAPGGSSQGRYQRRAEDSWAHNAARVADVLAAILRRSGARLLLLAGDVRALQYLDKHLPVWVHKEVTVRRFSGGRGNDGSRARRAEQIEQATRQAAEEERVGLREELANYRGTGGQAVEGVRETLAALSDGRVHTLLLTAEVQRQPAVWSGAASGGLAVRPDALLQAGIDVREVPLEDAAVRAAILTDAAVRIVSGDEPDQLADGISALCRFTA